MGEVPVTKHLEGRMGTCYQALLGDEYSGPGQVHFCSGFEASVLRPPTHLDGGF